MTASPHSNKPARITWIRWLILPLIFGIATIALIARTERQETEVTIAVTFNNLAEDLFLIAPPRQSIRLLVSGTPSALKTIDTKETAYRLDLSGLREGTHTVPVQLSDVDLPKGIALQSFLTPSLTIRLEKVSQKTVDIIAVLEGVPAPGFAVATVTLKPDRIDLKGTASLLAGIDTVKTAPINLEAAASSFKKEVPLNLPEAIVVDPPLRIVVAKVTVNERIITRVLEDTPVSVKGGTSADHQIQPTVITLTVRGPEPIVSTIETDPAFAVTVNIGGLPPGPHVLKATINLPLRITLVHISPERFLVTISK
jgi:YbbR domain-containing protein